MTTSVKMAETWHKERAGGETGHDTGNWRGCINCVSRRENPHVHLPCVRCGWALGPASMDYGCISCRSGVI